MRLRGRLWIRFLLILAALRLYRALRALLISARIDADLLVEVGDHDGQLVFRDLPWRDALTDAVTRPGTLDD